MLLHLLEKTLESPFDCKEIQPVNPKGNKSWIVIGRIVAKAETPILRPHDAKNQLIWLKVGEEGDYREWDGWMASPTRWTWVWVGSCSWSWTGKPGVLQSMQSQRIRHNWVTELKAVWERNLSIMKAEAHNYEYMTACTATPSPLKRKGERDRQTEKEWACKGSWSLIFPRSTGSLYE